MEKKLLYKAKEQAFIFWEGRLLCFAINEVIESIFQSIP
jgi:hypothetical protein